MSSVLYHVDAILKKHPQVKLNVIVISSATPLRNLIEGWKPDGFSARMKGNNAIFSLNIEKEGRPDESNISEDVLALQYGELPVYILISDDVGRSRETILVTFLNRYYPDISRLYLSSFELYHLLKELGKESKAKIEVDRLSFYSWIEPAHKRKRSDVSYTQEPLEPVFERVFREGDLVDKIQFTLLDAERTPLLNGYLSRKGLFRCRRSFTRFYETIIVGAAEMAQRKFNAFANRNRTEEHLTPQKLEISYDTDTLGSKDQLNYFIETLGTLKFSSMSIYHRNPYFHASVVDYGDGSSYDVWVVNTRKIHILPQLRANAASLARLVNHVFEFFSEGEIEGYIRIGIKRD